MSTVLVTGAGGFVGRFLCGALADAGFEVLAALRKDAAFSHPGVRKLAVGEIDGATEWGLTLRGVDAVVHLAALAHRPLRGLDAQAVQRYFEINGKGTGKLAEACAGSGVPRLLYLSSVKVNGEETFGRPFGPEDVPAPRDVYGQSKLQGEQAIQSLDATKVSWTIVRAPLVYGPGVRANFLRLMQWIDRGRPLPFGALTNRRSVIYLGNLSDLIINALRCDHSASHILMASDIEALSTPELCRRIAGAMGRKVRLWSIPPALLAALGQWVGSSAEVSRLTGSLEVDSSSTRTLLGWTPRFSTEEGIAETVRWYLRTFRAVNQGYS